MQLVQYSGLWLLCAVALNMWAWLSVLESGARISGKAIWSAVLLIFPGLGFVAWYVFGPRSARA